jgi:AcrR family transcriptional regulator
MPPKEKIKRENIIDAAFEIAEESGMDGISARVIAQKINASQVPIFRHFKNIDELKEEIIERAKQQLFEYTEKEYTGSLFLNIGVGFVLFSRDHRKLFEAISLNRDLNEYLLDTFAEMMKMEQIYLNMDREDRRDLVNKCYMAALGLAEAIAKDITSESTTEYIIETLNYIGGAVIEKKLRDIEYKKSKE